MRAVICEAYGPPNGLREVEIDKPSPGPTDVLVEVSATGLGFATGLMIQGLYQTKPPLPFCPGGEFAGVVTECGADVTGIHPGDRVFGQAGAAMADFVLANPARCFPIPEGVGDAMATSLYGNYLTAIHGLRDRGNLRAGETLLVLGASGGVGTAAVAVAKAIGANVIAGASTAAKREVALRCGADAVIDYTEENWRAALKPLCPDGLDVVYDPVGGEIAEPSFRSLAEGGRFLVVGFAAGTIPKIALNLPLLKTAAIVGVNWGGLSEAHPEENVRLAVTLNEWLASGRLKPAPVTERPAAEFVAAMEDQLAGRITGKLVLVR